MDIYAGTITGPYHEQRGETSQDAYWFLQERGFTVLAVADGAGSLPRSGVGAEIAVNTAVNETMDDLLGGESLEEAVRSGIECAQTSLTIRDDAHEIGCTLALAAYHEDGGWAAGTIGDSFIVITADRDAHTLITSPKPSEFNNITHLLTTSNVQPTIEHGEDRPLMISVASDGLAGASTKSGTPSGAFWAKVSDYATSGEGLDVDALLEFMNAEGRIEDDTTLIIGT